MNKTHKSDNALITEILTDFMTLEKTYDLSQLQEMVENHLGGQTIDDLHHKINAALQKRDGSGYRFVYHGNAQYSLVY